MSLLSMIVSPVALCMKFFLRQDSLQPDNDVVGFLTDAGYKNHYTRNTRQTV